MKKYSLSCPHCKAVPEGGRRAFIIVSTTEAKCWHCGTTFEPKLVTNDGNSEGTVRFVSEEK